MKDNLPEGFEEFEDTHEYHGWESSKSMRLDAYQAGLAHSEKKYKKEEMLMAILESAVTSATEDRDLYMDKAEKLEQEVAELKRLPPTCTYCDKDIDEGELWYWLSSYKTRAVHVSCHDNNLEDLLKERDELKAQLSEAREHWREHDILCAHCLQRNIGGAQCCCDWDGQTISLKAGEIFKARLAASREQVRDLQAWKVGAIQFHPELKKMELTEIVLSDSKEE